jgi:uncharacterized heparinase superfamily protein
LKKVRKSVQSAAYGNPIYQKILAAGDMPNQLRFAPPDIWPGDAQIGLALLAQQQSLFDQSGALRHDMTALMRGLRAVGSEAAQQAIRQMIEQWLKCYDNWHETEWSPAVLGKRIAAWLGFYEFYAPQASIEFIEDITGSLSRQWKHLLRAIPPSLTGLDGLYAIKGLIYGGLNFSDGERAIGLGLDLLRRQLQTEILPDGGHITRSPTLQLHMLRHLIDLRMVLQAAEISAWREIQLSIAALVPALRLYLHGDGGLALFHGGGEETPLLIEAVIAQSAIRARTLRRLPKTGYERLQAGRSLLITDIGHPPPYGYDQQAHAGLLSFEFGAGRERLIVNCGSIHGSEDWRLASASTAAHSTLTVEDTNACELQSDVAAVLIEAQRYEEDDAQCIDMMHDGYRPNFGLRHRRSLRLAGDGYQLQGRDELAGSSGRNFAVRWHLHPAVQASLLQGGQAALLRTAAGSGWRFRLEGASLGLESSVYCGAGAPHRSLQLKASGRTHGDPTTISWSLTREKRG